MMGCKPIRLGANPSGKTKYEKKQNLEMLSQDNSVTTQTASDMGVALGIETRLTMKVTGDNTRQ